MTNKSLRELQELLKNKNNELGELYVGAAGRELTDEEKLKESILSREINQAKNEIDRFCSNEKVREVMASRAKENANARLRELLTSQSY